MLTAKAYKCWQIVLLLTRISTALITTVWNPWFTLEDSRDKSEAVQKSS